MWLSKNISSVVWESWFSFSLIWIQPLNFILLLLFQSYLVETFCSWVAHQILFNQWIEDTCLILIVEEWDLRGASFKCWNVSEMDFSLKSLGSWTIFWILKVLKRRGEGRRWKWNRETRGISASHSDLIIGSYSHRIKLDLDVIMGTPLIPHLAGLSWFWIKRFHPDLLPKSNY